ncbi:FDLD family class I lanthipeptide [Tumebacillus flagellatus]|nr:FDLD family class I lanthipeptide [Tumebacillus flagellatus]
MEQLFDLDVQIKENASVGVVEITSEQCTINRTL